MSDQMQDLLNAIQRSNAAFQAERQELAKGDRGERGLPGKDGRDAKIVIDKAVGAEVHQKYDEATNTTHISFRFLPPPQGPIGETGPRGAAGFSPRLVLGEVKDGMMPAATLREIEPFVYELSLTLPRGMRGERGAQGLRGESIVGPKGDAITGPAGPAGAPGIDGKDGRDGMTREEIVKLVTSTMLEVFQQVGLRDEIVAKLLAAKTELRKAVNDADARSQYQLSEILKRVDRIVG